MSSHIRVVRSFLIWYAGHREEQVRDPHLAIEAYERKFGNRPNVVYFHPRDFERLGDFAPEGVRLVAAPTILLGHIGVAREV